MIRVEQNSAPLLRYVFDSDASNVTVRVLASDGTEVVPTTSAVTAVSATEYTYQLAPELTEVLDDLTVIWTATVAEVAQTYTDKVAVVGMLLFTNAEALVALGGTYSDAQIEDARTYAETELERALGYALVPRYERRTFSGNGTSTLLLPPYTRAVRWIEVPGAGAGTVTYDGGMILTNPSGWPRGIDNITAGVEHGLDVGNGLLPGAKRAALSMAVEYLGGGAVDPRAERLITDDGTIVYASGAGQFRAPGVNEWVAANRLLISA